MMRGAWAMRGLGGLLLVAAGLKMYGLAVEPVGRAGIFSEPWLQTLIVEWEIALGIWLVWGVNRALAWLAATATFLAFAGFSFWQGWVGQTSCGCFGAVHVSPWSAFAMDLFALAALGFGRTRRLTKDLYNEISGTGYNLSAWLATVAFLSAGFAAFAYFQFGSVDSAIAYLRGDQVSVRPSYVDLGANKIGDVQEIGIEFTNREDHAIRIVGGTSDCACVTTAELPIILAPGESRVVAITFRFTGAPGNFTRTAEFFVDDGQVFRIRIRLSGLSVASNRHNRLATLLPFSIRRTL